MDISTFGPKRGNEKIYNKYVSEFSPDGLVHIVKVKIKSKDSNRSEALNNLTIIQFYLIRILNQQFLLGKQGSIQPLKEHLVELLEMSTI